MKNKPLIIVFILIALSLTSCCFESFGNPLNSFYSDNTKERTDNKTQVTQDTQNTNQPANTTTQDPDNKDKDTTEAKIDPVIKVYEGDVLSPEDFSFETNNIISLDNVKITLLNTESYILQSFQNAVIEYNYINIEINQPNLNQVYDEITVISGEISIKEDLWTLITAKSLFTSSNNILHFDIEFICTAKDNTEKVYHLDYYIQKPETSNNGE